MVETFHPLQYGFSESMSCTQAIFLISESIAESKDKGLVVYITSINVQKAFDVIHHESLLAWLFQLGLRGAWWSLNESAYKDLKEISIWYGKTSEPFLIKQGSKQGAYPVETTTLLISYSRKHQHHMDIASAPSMWHIGTPHWFPDDWNDVGHKWRAYTSREGTGSSGHTQKYLITKHYDWGLCSHGMKYPLCSHGLWANWSKWPAGHNLNSDRQLLYDPKSPLWAGSSEDQCDIKSKLITLCTYNQSMQRPRPTRMHSHSCPSYPLWRTTHTSETQHKNPQFHPFTP